jgi:hypothetical protein
MRRVRGSDSVWIRWFESGVESDEPFGARTRCFSRERGLDRMPMSDQHRGLGVLGRRRIEAVTLPLGLSPIGKGLLDRRAVHEVALHWGPQAYAQIVR